MVERIIYLNTAVHDLRSIYNYISEDSVRYALLEIKKIKAYAESLVYHPTKGKYFKTIRGKEIRSANFKSYIIFYHINETEQIQILSIHHHSRAFANNPALSDED